MRNILLLFSMLLVTVSALFSSKCTAQVLPDKFNDGFTSAKPSEFYNQGNLFELIDGQAVFYLSYGFVKLEHRFYTDSKGVEYKVDIYELADALSGLGSYREQKDNEAAPLGIGTEGYLADYLAAFYKNKFYVEITPTGSGDLDKDAITKLSADVEKTIPGDTIIPPEIKLFPQEGIKPGSERYYGESLLSYTFLGKGLSALYNQKDGENDIRVFVSFAGSVDASLKTSEEFVKVLKNTSKVSLSGKLDGIKGEMAYRGNSMIFHSGKYAFGCIGVIDEQKALVILQKLLENLNKLYWNKKSYETS
jgi:hypothetical protein